MQRKKKKSKSKRKTQIEEENFSFYFIAGHTENGMPYGISMTEAKELGLLDETADYTDSDLPF